MSWHRPSPKQVWEAINLYLKLAYPDDVPSAVRARLDTLASLSDEDFYDSAVFEHEPRPNPPRFTLRLGNEFYPHMKLVIQRTPDGRSHLFRVDTHDQHCRPEPRSRDYRPFCQLMERNQNLSQAIENAWATRHLPTFKSYLKQDLDRRRT